MNVAIVLPLIAAMIISVIGIIIFIIVMIMRKIRRTKMNNIKEDNVITRKTLGETIKDYRVKCNMTQEFVAESIDVSRQAVSKWENGVTDPSTTNLFALAKLFGIPAEDLLKNVNHHNK